jgi:Heterokaryon incompatibility protein (HET)
MLIGVEISLGSDEDLQDDSENTHTGSMQNFELASKWLDRCEEHHPDCYAYQNAISALPTRVLDVGPPDGSKEPELRDATFGIAAYYATLSHRWGQGSPITTTLATLAERKRGIPMSTLPKTFQDAIIIARNLRTKYLWIDSLCIIQDSNEDWETEAKRMGEYYGRARFNIAASDAADCTEGCFRERNPACLKGCKVDIQISRLGKNKTSVFVVPSIEDVTDWRSGVASFLDSRGWIFQERLLARRTLFYGRFQLTYSCSMEDASEIHQKGIPHDKGYFEARRAKGFSHFERIQTTLRRPAYDPDTRLWVPIYPAHTNSIPNWEAKIDYGSYHPQNSREFQPYTEWHALVEAYVTREFKSPYDILPALSGLAASFSTCVSSFYIAGMWSLDFRRTLLWRVDDPLPHNAHRLDPPRAPSWSWASIPCQRLKFTSQTMIAWSERKVSIIEDIQIYPLDGGPRGAIGGRLQVRGWLIPAVVNSNGNSTEDMKQKFKLSMPESGLDVQNIVYPVVFSGVFHPDALDVVGTNIWCLPLRNRELHNSPTAVLNIIGLAAVENEKEMTFTRIGEGTMDISRDLYEGSEMVKMVII